MPFRGPFAVGFAEAWSAAGSRRWMTRRTALRRVATRLFRRLHSGVARASVITWHKGTGPGGAGPPKARKRLRRCGRGRIESHRRNCKDADLHPRARRGTLKGGPTSRKTHRPRKAADRWHAEWSLTLVGATCRATPSASARAMPDQPGGRRAEQDRVHRVVSRTGVLDTDRSMTSPIESVRYSRRAVPKGNV